MSSLDNSWIHSLTKIGSFIHILLTSEVSQELAGNSFILYNLSHCCDCDGIMNLSSWLFPKYQNLRIRGLGPASKSNYQTLHSRVKDITHSVELFAFTGRRIFRGWIVNLKDCSLSGRWAFIKLLVGEINYLNSTMSPHFFPKLRLILFTMVRQGTWRFSPLTRQNVCRTSQAMLGSKSQNRRLTLAGIWFQSKWAIPISRLLRAERPSAPRYVECLMPLMIPERLPKSKP